MADCFERRKLKILIQIFSKMYAEISRTFQKFQKTL
jgi:hypothetical protein